MISLEQKHIEFPSFSTQDELLVNTERENI